MSEKNPSLRKGRIIDLQWKVAFYDPMNFFLYLLFGGERNFRRRIIGYAELKEGQRILDIGCATGGNIAAVLDTQNIELNVCGLDAAFNIMKVAKNKVLERKMHCGFVQGLAESLPFKDNSLDRILNVFMLHHIRYESKIKVLKEIFRVLKPGGILVLVDPSKPYNMLGRFLALLRAYVPEIRESLAVPLAGLAKEGGFDNAEVLQNCLGCFSFIRARKG